MKLYTALNIFQVQNRPISIVENVHFGKISNQAWFSSSDMTTAIFFRYSLVLVLDLAFELWNKNCIIVSTFTWSPWNQSDIIYPSSWRHSTIDFSIIMHRFSDQRSNSSTQQQKFIFFSITPYKKCMLTLANSLERLKALK